MFKTYYLLIVSFLSSCILCAGQELSNVGKAHWITANALSEMASSAEDYIQIAEEYEKIISSDPAYPETYVKLCQVNCKIGSTLGNEYFDKADNALAKYRELSTHDEQTYLNAKVMLDALREKYNRGPNRFCGKWKRNDNSKDWFIDIQYKSGSYTIICNEDRYQIEEAEPDTFILMTTRRTDHRDELNTRGWNYYVDDRDSDADEGYPTQGQYKYDMVISKDYYKISLEGDVPILTLFKMHHTHYLNGIITYCETKTNEWWFPEGDMVKY